LIYAIRIFDLFQQLPCSLAILCDSNVTWRPKEKILATQGSRLIFEFTAVKLLDYQAQWADLEASMNPFATVVMAHLKAQQTKSKAEERKTWKIELMRGLYEKGYNRGQIVELFKFVDWLIVLPAKLEESFWNDLKTLEEERKMPFVTSVERIGYQRGQKETIEEVILKMLEEQVPLETIAKVADLSISELERFIKKQTEKTQSQQK
jgi:hypothetical protein